MNHEPQLNAIIGSDALRIDFLGDETDLIQSSEKLTTDQKSHSLNDEAFLTQMDTDTMSGSGAGTSLETNGSTTATVGAQSVNSASNDNAQKEKAEEERVEKELAELTTRDIRSAQCELRQLDIHVCGGCHSVFHFVEEFNSHKNDNQCRQKPKFHANVAEKKPQIWGYLLWRSSQQKKTTSNGETRTTPLESSWRLYQKWCKMPESLRKAWVAGGEKIMEITTSYMMPSKKVNVSPPLIEEDTVKGPVVMKKLVQRGEAGEIMKIQSHSETKKRFDSAELLRKQLEEDSLIDSSNKLVGSQEPLPQPPQETLREEEFVVEKIVSRRYNPRKKQFEYLLKWEGYPPEQNTWEPAENLEACQHLLKAFEESLNKQALNKLNKASSASASTTSVTSDSAFSASGVSSQNSLARKYENSRQTSNTTELNSFGRPVRHSKQKALNQVKAWCGSIKPDDAEIEAMRKRTLGDSETDDDAEDPTKRFRLEGGTDSEDSLSRSKFGRGFGKRGPGRPAKQGHGRGALPSFELDGVDGEKTLQFIQESKVQSGKSLTPASQQVLVASAKGVVQVDPSQVPNLSSGVYIMSNKSGIIKLDSVSPSKALSMKLSMVHDMTKPAPLAPPTTSATTVGGGGVITLNRQQQGTQRTGVVRRTPLTTETSHATKMPPILPGAKPITKPTRPTGSIKINGPNPRPSTQSIVSQNKLGHILNTQPKTPQNSSKVGRSGLTMKDDTRRVPGSISSVSSNKTGGKHGDESFLDIRLSSDSENGVDDFPTDLQPIPPASPPRPYTLCPKSGIVLLKAEGEKTPSPPQSPAVQIKEEPKEEKLTPVRSDTRTIQTVASQTHQKVGMNQRKESLVKKSLGTHGSVGSVTISPKKTESEVSAVAEDDEVVTITAEDGMVYKMSRAELNNSLLMANEDGQHCVYVTTGENGEDNAVLALDPSSYSDAQLNQVSILGEGAAVVATGEDEENQGVSSTQFYVKELSEDSGENQSQLVAQVVEASEPAPGGGPRRVVLMLPDGNLMMTEMDEEQYAALELDKFQAQATEIE